MERLFFCFLAGRRVTSHHVYTGHYWQSKARQFQPLCHPLIAGLFQTATWNQHDEQRVHHTSITIQVSALFVSLALVKYLSLDFVFPDSHSFALFLVFFSPLIIYIFCCCGWKIVFDVSGYQLLAVLFGWNVGRIWFVGGGWVCFGFHVPVGRVLWMPQWECCAVAWG